MRNLIYGKKNDLYIFRCKNIGWRYLRLHTYLNPIFEIPFRDSIQFKDYITEHESALLWNLTQIKYFVVELQSFSYGFVKY